MRILSAYSLGWPQASGDVSLHALDRGGILFDAIGQKLYGVNATAAFIWCCIEDGLTPGESIERLAETLGIAHDDAEDYTDEIVGRWREFGLIGDPTGAIRRLLAENTVKEPTPKPSPGVDPDANGAELRHIAATRHYRVLDTRFRMRFGSETLLHRLEPFLAPLAAAPSRSGPVLDVRLGRGGISLHVDGKERDRCLDDRAVVPMIKANLVPIALERSRDFCALHAAAVARGGKCILMPGAAGRGKSTMAAGLVALGVDLLGDDTVVLARDGLEARSLPLAIGVKAGAWDLLDRYFPALAAEPIHHRPDGKDVRYLMPPGERLCRDHEARFAVHGIIFLHRLPGASATLSPVTASEALARISNDFLPLGAPLDRVGVELFLQWISRLACYELRYGTLEEGCAHIVSILP
jgi:hypothetical protein